MNREIKFRAWHKIRKEMYTVHGWHSEFVFKDTLDGIGCDGNPDKLEDVILLQFTGLKDKKGKEIYEGDICMTRDSYSDGGELNDLLICQNYNSFIYSVIYSEEHSGLNGYAQTKLLVIGNIHQNPELLE